jgi:hypothetical protein
MKQPKKQQPSTPEPAIDKTTRLRGIAVFSGIRPAPNELKIKFNGQVEVSIRQRTAAPDSFQAYWSGGVPLSDIEGVPIAGPLGNVQERIRARFDKQEKLWEWQDQWGNSLKGAAINV